MTETLSRSARQIELTETFAAHNYDPLPVIASHGDGSWVTDVDGRRYLDCLAAYSALNFGHRHPALIEAARAQWIQTRRSWHGSVRMPGIWSRATSATQQRVSSRWVCLGGVREA